MARGRKNLAAAEDRAGRASGLAPGNPLMVPWHLDLGPLESHQLALEHLGRELVLCFDPPLGTTDLSLTRIAIVQPGSHLELPPWHTPSRSLLLPWAKAPLDDLWLLLCTAARRSWLEVPYGLCRSLDEVFDAPQLGPPRAPPDAALDDAVIPWEALRFKLGPASGWQLSLLARQGRTGELEIVARRAEPGVPPPIALAASVGPRPLAIEQYEAWSAEPAPLHVARYRLPPAPLGARAHVRVIVKCGSSSFEVHLPTSLTDRSHRSAGRREVVR